MYLSTFPQAMTRDGEEGESPPMRVHVMEIRADVGRGRRAAHLGLDQEQLDDVETRKRTEKQTAFFVEFRHTLSLMG